MIFDALTTLSSAQDLTGLTGDIPSTNVLDLSVQRDIGASEEDFVVCWTTLPVGAGVTINIAMQTSVDNTTWVTLLETGQQPITNFGPQNFFAFRSDVPVGTRRYLRMLYQPSGALTAGALTAGIGVEYPVVVYYGRNYVA